jgi:hypothetical protein
VESASQLLEKHAGEMDLFDMEPVSGVTALVFGVVGGRQSCRTWRKWRWMRLVSPLGTSQRGVANWNLKDNTNGADLELYVLMAEHDKRR